MFLATLLALATAPVTVRTGKLDITPPEALPLGGYTERQGKKFEAGGDPLYARCIVLRQGEQKIAVLSVEMLTCPESLYRDVAKQLPADLHLFIQATHTHCAPDSQMLNDRMTFAIPGIATYKRRWLQWYAGRLATAVRQAMASKEATVTDLGGFSCPVPANRARREGGKPDPKYLSVSSTAGTLFTFYTAHPTVYGPEELHLRGDWIGAMAAKNDTLVLNGAIGDVSPAADGPTSEAKLDDFFGRIKSVLQRVRLRRLPYWKSTDTVRWTERPIPLDPKKPHPTFAKSNGIPEHLAQSLVDRFAPPEAKVIAIRVGKLAIIGVPGEPTSILGNAIEAAGLKMGYTTVLVCSHVNGWMGYILDPADYDRGGYEATLSFYGRAEGAKVVDTAIAALKKLSG